MVHKILRPSQFTFLKRHYNPHNVGSSTPCSYTMTYKDTHEKGSFSSPSQHNLTHLDSFRKENSLSQSPYESLYGDSREIESSCTRLNASVMIDISVHYRINDQLATIENINTMKTYQLPECQLMSHGNPNYIGQTDKASSLSFVEQLRLMSSKSKEMEIHTVTDRLYTFTANNWLKKCNEWWPRDLAEAGFYYRDNRLEVHCFSCKLKTDVLDWYLVPKENPTEAHARINPDCNYVVGNFYKPKLKLPKHAMTLKDVMSMKNKEDNSSLQLMSEEKGDTQMDSMNAVQSNLPLTQTNTTDSTILPLKNDDGHINGLHINFPKISIKQKPTDQERNATSFHSNGVTPSLKASNDTTLNIQTPVNGFESTIDDTRNNQASFLYRDSMNSQITFDGMSRQYIYDTDNKMYKYPQYQLKSARLKTFDNWKFQHKQMADILAETGYFYTGEKDIVRCFCCDLGLAEWDPKDDPWIEHARHSPKCLYLKNQKGIMYIETIQLDWKKIYNPKHAAFDDKITRLATFDGWRSDIEQTPEILAEAGFFFTGEEDVVRCHYCDGGLRHWESGDIPWEEHAKWFPFCKFVIKMKGREYVEEMKKKREAIEQGQDMENGSSTGLTETAANLDVLQNLRSMQFENSQITHADNEYYKRHGNRNYSTEDLVELILEGPRSPFKAANVLDKSPKEKDPLKIMETNRQLKERLKCIRCRKNDTCMLFVNCGHRVTCESCAERMDFCPVCDKRIKKRLKTFLS